MSSASPPPAAPTPDSGEQLSLVDLTLVREYAHFGFGAIARHPIKSILAFTMVVASAALSVWALPRSYHVECRLLAQPNEIMAALGNPGRSVPGGADVPTRSAAETILQHANLVALVRQTNLLEEWEKTRAPAVRLKDAIVARVSGKPTEEDRLDALVGLVEKRLKVTTPERVVQIEIDWPDAQMAYQLIDAAQQNFLETRHAMEVSAIAESISIIETHTATARANVDQARDDMRAIREAQSRGHLAPDAPVRIANRTTTARASHAADPELDQLKSLLKAKHDAIKDLEGFRRKRLTELQGQLTETLATFAPAHPAVLTLRQTIEQMQRDSPQLVELRQDEQQLLAQYIRKGGRDPDAPAGTGPTSEPSMEGRAVLRAAPRPVADSPPAAAADIPMPEDLNVAEDQLRMTGLKYDDLLGRLEAARIELDTARAAFKYRYSVVTPPEVPKQPTKPNVPLTAIAGLVGGLLLALLVSVLSDLRSGKLVEEWQIQRDLGLPVLAEVDRL